MNVFFDTSALVKLVLREPDSEQARTHWQSAARLAVSELALPEAISAFCRRRREGALTPLEYADSKLALFGNLNECQTVRVSPAILDRAVWLLERWTLRAADALQLASAAAWGADLMLSADARQCTAARGVGLRVEQLALGA